MAEYDPDEFFSAERYPLPMKCPECGKTMRPVHKHRMPDMPRYYFCTFCDATIPENHPSIRFRKPITNADYIRAMSDEELAEMLSDLELSVAENLVRYIKEESNKTRLAGLRLDWLRQEADNNTDDIPIEYYEAGGT